MIYTIENERFRVSVRNTGAELAGFADKSDGGYEYVRQPDEIWDGQSPLLFPVVGRLRDDVYDVYGQRYTLEKHGFARKLPFEVEKRSTEELVFLLKDDEKTRKQFPFAFELRVRYAFAGDGFVMEHRVKNMNDRTMYFSIGAHPGFNIEMGDKVVLDEDETASAFRLDANALRAKERLPVFENSRELVITPDVFAEDALIFDGLESKGATVVKADGRNVHVDFGGAPCLGLWAKPGAKYVCIEPWYGIDDRFDAQHDFSRKERICSLEAGEEFVFPVTIRITK